MSICTKIPNDGSFHNSGGKHVVVSKSAEIAYKDKNELSSSFFILSLFDHPRQNKKRLENEAQEGGRLRCSNIIHNTKNVCAFFLEI